VIQEQASSERCNYLLETLYMDMRALDMFTDFSRYSVKVGITDLNDESGNVQTLGVQKIIFVCI